MSPAGLGAATAIGGATRFVVFSAMVMAAISLVGAATLLLTPAFRARVMQPLVAFSAGALVGGALFHLLPTALGLQSTMGAMTACAAGFTAFLGLEHLLHRHHCRRAAADCRRPVTWLILLGDALHNLLDGLAVGAAFVVDARLGVSTFLATAAHELPQELGDFAVLVDGGWSPRRALGLNLLASLTYLLGGLMALTAATMADVRWLVAVAAGQFLYIGASDLVPEVNKPESARASLTVLGAFLAGGGLLLALAMGE
jgi:zinc and cadmium transporter